MHGQAYIAHTHTHTHTYLYDAYAPWYLLSQRGHKKDMYPYSRKEVAHGEEGVTQWPTERRGEDGSILWTRRVSCPCGRAAALGSHRIAHRIASRDPISKLTAGP